MTRSVIMDSYRSATLENYRANSDIVKEWEWLATLSDRTCGACLALDGRRFPLTVEFQPSHPNCRCTSIPVIDGVPPIEREKGSDWFAKQSSEVQDATLGKKG